MVKNNWRLFKSSIKSAQEITVVITGGPAPFAGRNPNNKVVISNPSAFSGLAGEKFAK